MKHISVVTPCFNEEGNVRELYQRVKKVFSALEGYTYEHIFIDNASRDRTVAILKEIAREDPSVKIIVNARNFGQVRSPYHAMLQAPGDAVITMAADLQDPPEMIEEFIHRWEEGYMTVIGVKDSAEESKLMFAIRTLYYRIASRLADTELYRNFTGFGLYDRRFIDIVRQMDDQYPYFRGQIAEIGFDCCKIPYRQPNRKAGITTNNFYRLYDMAMLGITNHSKVPLRLATILGFAMSILSLVLAFGYLVAKLLFWDRLPARDGPDDHQPVLLLVGAAVLHRHSRRVYRRHPHPGPQTAPCGRKANGSISAPPGQASIRGGHRCPPRRICACSGATGPNESPGDRSCRLYLSAGPSGVAPCCRRGVWPAIWLPWYCLRWHCSLHSRPRRGFSTGKSAFAAGTSSAITSGATLYCTASGSRSMTALISTASSIPWRPLTPRRAGRRSFRFIHQRPGSSSAASP